MKSVWERQTRGGLNPNSKDKLVEHAMPPSLSLMNVRAAYRSVLHGQRSASGCSNKSKSGTLTLLRNVMR